MDFESEAVQVLLDFLNPLASLPDFDPEPAVASLLDFG
jgi:hypothetical protein